jgi:hypothetical protein
MKMQLQPREEMECVRGVVRRTVSGKLARGEERESERKEREEERKRGRSLNLGGVYY